MIFNTSDLKEERNENTVKGYDYEEDDLSEIESMIKAANIKRYTRKNDTKNIQRSIKCRS